MSSRSHRITYQEGIPDHAVRIFCRILRLPGTRSKIFHVPTHTSGISSIPNSPEYPRPEPFPLTPEQNLEKIRDMPPAFAPGSLGDRGRFCVVGLAPNPLCRKYSWGFKLRQGVHQLRQARALTDTITSAYPSRGGGRAGCGREPALRRAGPATRV
jgi:hypothetical protein